MITTLRKSFKTKIYKIVLIVTLLAVGGIFSVIEIARTLFFGGKNWVLKINNEKIYQPQLARNITDQEERIRLLRSQYGEYADLYFQLMGMKPNATQLAIDTIIKKELLNQASASLPLYVSKQQITEKLSDIMFLYQEISDLVPLFAWDPTLNALNMIILQNYLNRIGVSIHDLDLYVLQGIKRQTLTRLLGAGVYVPDFQVKEAVVSKYVPHQFSILTYTESDIINQLRKEAITDEQLKKFFDLKNNQEKKYFIPEKRSALTVTFEPNEYGIEVKPEEIETYYENHKAQYVEKPAHVQVRRILFSVPSEAQRQSIEEKAEKVRKELLKNPSDFAQKAQELSQDSQTAKEGGLIPFFSKGQKEPTFERAAFVLAKESDISPVISTKDGIELLQLVSKKQQVFTPLNQVKSTIKEQLLARKFDSQFNSDIRALYHAGSEKVQEFIKKHRGKEKEVSDFTFDNVPLARILFKLGKNESSSYKEGNKGIYVTLTAIQESSIPPFDSVKNRVKEDYLKDQAHKKLVKLLQDAKKNAKNSLISDSLYQGLLKKTDWLTKEEAAKNEEFTKRGVAIDQIFQLENIGEALSFEYEDKGSVVRLEGTKPLSDELLNEKKEQVRAELSKEQNNLITSGFIASLHRNATIVKNESQLPLAS